MQQMLAAQRGVELQFLIYESQRRLLLEGVLEKHIKKFAGKDNIFAGKLDIGVLFKFRDGGISRARSARRNRWPRQNCYDSDWDWCS